MVHDLAPLPCSIGFGPGFVRTVGLLVIQASTRTNYLCCDLGLHVRLPCRVWLCLLVVLFSAVHRHPLPLCTDVLWVSTGTHQCVHLARGATSLAVCCVVCRCSDWEPPCPAVS